MSRLENFIIRQGFVLVLLGLFAGPVPADEEGAENGPHTRLVEVDDLQALGQTARQAGVPILLMFASEECPYCERLEAEVLGPMVLAGDDPRRVLLRKVMLETADSLRDFQGRMVSADELARRKGVDMVPALYLLDGTGRELVPRIVGYTSPDFYPAYLDQAIDVARGLLPRGEGR
ncbi:MAG TPA: hypothetical protein ENK51_10305 [Gammaproteobacteria bacterium]|nr:hypothetical protein [Gammaproteobacteria bacterium]